VIDKLRYVTSPIRIRNLLTHSTGFNQRNINTGTKNSSEIKNLGNFLAETMPKRVYEPGRFFTYSNQGMSMAAYIVEETSATLYADYMEKEIFKPLEMYNSTYKQPMPENLAEYKAKGYRPGTTGVEVGDMFYHNLGAAGCWSTVEDMSHFIIANLNNGVYKQNLILKETTLEEMQKKQFTNHPAMPGQTYGFWERIDNGQRGLFHTGTTDGYANMFYIMPEYKIGFILSYNSSTDKLRSEFIKEFIDTYFPAQQNDAAKIIDKSLAGEKDYEGLYWNVESPKYTLDKCSALFSGEIIRTKWTEEGTIKVSSLWGNDLGTYAETEPMVFTKVNNNERIAFDSIDYIQHVFIKNNAYEKIKWYENPLIFLGLFLFSFLVIFISFAVWSIRHFKDLSNNLDEKHSKIETYAKSIAFGIASLNLILTITTGIVMSRLGMYAFMFGVPVILKVMLFRAR